MYNSHAEANEAGGLALFLSSFKGREEPSPLSRLWQGVVPTPEKTVFSGCTG